MTTIQSLAVLKEQEAYIRDRMRAEWLDVAQLLARARLRTPASEARSAGPLLHQHLDTWRERVRQMEALLLDMDAMAFERGWLEPRP